MLASPIDDTLHEGLEAFDGFAHPVFVSTGVDPEVVAGHAERVTRAHAHLHSTLDRGARFALLVLGPDDWAPRSEHPVYGMPNYNNGNLVVAATSNPFWHAFAELIGGVSLPDGPAVADVYRAAGDSGDLTPFFDLLAVHELAHVFIEQRPVHFPRLWLTELACNLALHSYVAACEPELLTTLETFPRAMGAIDPSRFSHRRLAEFDCYYAHGMEPLNYGWYQCRFHVAAATVHDASDGRALRALWDEFGRDETSRRDTSTDASLAELLAAVVQDRKSVV